MVALPCTLNDWRALGIEGTVHYGHPALALPYRALLARKIRQARALIEDWWCRVEGRGYVSVSFGKDSLVAWHLAQQVAPVPAAWVNQGPLAEWPDCLALKDILATQYGMELHEVTPDVTVYEWYRTHGIPASAAMDSAEDKALNEALMYAPLRRFIAEYGWRGTLWGIRGVNEPHREGKHREILLNTRGLLYQRQSDHQWIGSPVGRWRIQEIWAYIDLHRLPYPAMYDLGRMSIRNGPPLGTSAMNLGRLEKLHQYFPEIYRVVTAHFPRLGGHAG